MLSMSVASAVLTDMDTLLRHVLNVRQHGAGEGIQGSGDVQGHVLEPSLHAAL